MVHPREYRILNSNSYSVSWLSIEIQGHILHNFEIVFACHLQGEQGKPGQDGTPGPQGSRVGLALTIAFSFQRRSGAGLLDIKSQSIPNGEQIMSNPNINRRGHEAAKLFVFSSLEWPYISLWRSLISWHHYSTSPSSYLSNSMHA